MTTPPSAPVPPHSCPSARPQLAGPLGGATPHVPNVFPLATAHVPVQQSALVAHASPGCPQNDDDWQVPLLHRPEQHSADDAQLLPSVLHIGFSGAHVL